MEKNAKIDNSLALESCATRLFNTIKADNFLEFGVIVAENPQAKNFCFGRFPLLSVCFLFDAKRIIAKYQKDLIAISSSHYISVKEPFDIYQKFKNIAGVTLRYYVIDKNIVSPSEMLAVLNNVDDLKQVYPKSSKSESSNNRIIGIFDRLYNEKAIINSNNIIVTNVKLPKFITIAVVFILIFSILACAGACTLQKFANDTWYAKGSIDSPIKVYSSKALQSYLSMDTEGLYYQLYDNCELQSFGSDTTIKANILGNGYSVSFDVSNAPLMKIFAGSLADCTININGELNYDGNTSLFATTNSGTLTNINVNLNIKLHQNDIPTSGSDSSPYTPKDVYLSCLFQNNSGSIQNLKIDGSATVTGNCFDNVYLSLLVNTNNGIISSCSATDTTTISLNAVENRDLIGYNSYMVDETTINNAVYKTEEIEAIPIFDLATFETYLNANNKLTFSIEDDLSLTSINTISTASATIDGKGHRVYVDLANSPIIDTFQGTFKNVTFVISGVQTYQKSFGFIINNNKGTLDNINVEFNNIELTEKSSETPLSEETTIDAIGIGGLVNTNNYLIDNCFVSGSITLSSDGTGDVYFGGIAYDNYGTIRNTSSTDKLTISSDTVDIAGISAINNYRILACTNAGKVTQTTNSDAWSPNASGITTKNNHTISSCKNIGDISATSTANCQDDKTTSVLASGIACTNEGTISSSINQGNISATSVNSEIYLSGISSINYSEISKCKAYGSISSTTNGEVYIGGISGMNLILSENYGFYTMTKSYGFVEYCYSECTINHNSTIDSNAFIGGISGFQYRAIQSSFNYLQLVRYSISNCTVIANDNTNTYIGGITGCMFLNYTLTELVTNKYVTKSNITCSHGATCTSSDEGLVYENCLSNYDSESCTSMDSVYSSELYQTIFAEETK